MRLGRRQLDVLRAADAGCCSSRHAGQGRMTVNGLDDVHPDVVLERLLETGLVRLGSERISGHDVELTDAGAQELNEQRRREVM